MTATTGSPGTDTRQLDQLLGLLRQQRPVEAEQLARQLLQQQAQHPLVWQLLGMAQKAQGRYTDAIPSLQQAIALAPAQAPAHELLGDCLLASAQTQAAADSFRRVLALQAGHAAAHVKLGNALALQQQIEPAADAYRRAIALHKGLVEAHANLGFTLLSAGRYAEAEAPLRHALQSQPEAAPLHNALGVALYGLQRMEDAAASFEQAVQRMPDHPEAQANYANALRELGQFDQALNHYGAALRLHPRFVRAQFDLGGLHYLRGDFAAAEHAFRHTLELSPKHQPAWNNLGRSLRKQGRLDEARQCFEQALRLAPDHIDTYYNLAPLRRFTADDAEPQRLHGLRAQAEQQPLDTRIRYWFALGKLQEDCGRYDQAFEAYAQGNALKKNRLPDREALLVSMLEQVREVFNHDTLRPQPSAPQQRSRIPVFIVGMPRSGTSLIEQILATHPQVYGAGELPTLEKVLLDALPADTPLHEYPVALSRLSEAQRMAIGEAYLEQVWQLAPDAQLITDKMMSNFAHIGLIRSVLPQARIVHAMRDPMDSCFSCYATLFAGDGLDYSYALDTLGRYYVRYMQTMAHWREVLPADAILDLRYETLVDQPEQQARRLLDYLGLPWNPDCLQFHTTQRVVKTASAAQVRQPLYRSSVARWQRFETQLQPLLQQVAAYRP